MIYPNLGLRLRRDDPSPDLKFFNAAGVLRVSRRTKIYLQLLSPQSQNEAPEKVCSNPVWIMTALWQLIGGDRSRAGHDIIAVWYGFMVRNINCEMWRKDRCLLNLLSTYLNKWWLRTPHMPYPYLSGRVEKVRGKKPIAEKEQHGHNVELSERRP